jgi:hypothetical protein
MFTDKKHYKNLTRVCLILVYVSFYLVQLNIHFGKASDRSFFSGDFISQRTGDNTHETLNSEHQKESKVVGFRLNKRFHPSYLFFAPEVLQNLVKYSFCIETTLLNETQPLANFSFNAASLRGPPAIV